MLGVSVTPELGVGREQETSRFWELPRLPAEPNAMSFRLSEKLFQGSKAKRQKKTPISCLTSAWVHRGTHICPCTQHRAPKREAHTSAHAHRTAHKRQAHTSAHAHRTEHTRDRRTHLLMHTIYNTKKKRLCVLYRVIFLRKKVILQKIQKLETSHLGICCIKM